MNILQKICRFVAILGLGGCALWRGSECGPPPASGSNWVQEDAPGVSLRFDRERILVAGAGVPLHLAGIEEREGPLVFVRNGGLREVWALSCAAGRLGVDSPKIHGTFRRASRSRGPELDRPVRLPPPRALSPRRVGEIQRQLADLLAADQGIRKDGNTSVAERIAVGREVDRNFHRLLKEVGWIDVPRFGDQASSDAGVLAKHSGDLALLTAVLPLVERDLAHSEDTSQVFAIFYDETQIALGRKQRYGSQLQVDAKGEPFVLPLEDPERVEELRRSIALPPLADYLRDASEALFGGRAIRMARPDE